MPPKRTKKTSSTIESGVQTKLSFHRRPKEQTKVSHLIQVLSQYQLMIMVTNNLSSADIVHLTSTCKEIKSYLTDDKNIFKTIKSHAVCDGKGIVARAKCFGHWKGDASEADVACEGAVCLPCDNCDALVCNTCRYHVTYFDNLPCCKSDPFHWDSHEADYAVVLESVRHCHNDHCGECPDFHSGNFPIEGIRAALLAGEPREQRFCKDCKPVSFESAIDMLLALDEYGEWCLCTVADKFIEERWLCIPCFLEAEAKAYGFRPKREVYEWKKKKYGESIRKHVKTEYFCDCGKVANVPYLVRCRWCEEYIQTSEVNMLFEDL